jgi:hypothetical protein
MGYTLGINRLDCKYLLHMFLLCYWSLREI